MNDDYPSIDLAQLERQKEQNFQERLTFIRQYVAWQKSVPNDVWSTAQKKLFARRGGTNQTALARARLEDIKRDPSNGGTEEDLDAYLASRGA